MDDLIFTFTQRQYELFLQIQEQSQKERVAIEFDFTISSYTDHFSSKMGDIFTSITEESERLLELEERGNVFSTFLSSKKIAELTPIFYDVTDKIEALRSNMYILASDISKELSKWQGHENAANEKYALFLPYKAALSESPDYGVKIVEVERQYFSAVDLITKRKEDLIALLCTIGAVCDRLIPDFLEEIALAADMPRFEKFSDRAFFSSVRNFIQRIKAYK